MRRIILIAVVTWSCNTHNISQQKIVDTSLRSDNAKTPAPPLGKLLIKENLLLFLDSVSSKMQLTISQIRKYTKIDSLYYTPSSSDVIFTGDTVIAFTNGNKGAVIKYDDKQTCLNKFLLIFSRGATTCSVYKIIYTDCDRDESSDYTRLNYKFSADSTFTTTQTFIPLGADEEGKHEEIVNKWKVNYQGKIVKLANE